MLLDNEGSVSSSQGDEFVSIVVTNFNYAKYLPACINSILAQDYSRREIIIVDDGSTDGSREIIASYGASVRPLFTANGGQVMAWAAGLVACRGEIVVFFDADDIMLPGALTAHVQALRQKGSVRSQGYMIVVDEAGRANGERIPGRPAQGGDLRDLMLSRGPGCYISPPTSGNAWRKSFLDQIFPLPAAVPKAGADAFLMDAAPIFGSIVTIDRAVAEYRVHGNSQSQKRRALTYENIERVVTRYDYRIKWLTGLASRQGYADRVKDWEKNNWRLLTLRYLHGRISNGKQGPKLGRHLLSAAFGGGGSLITRMGCVLLVAAIRGAPLVVARTLRRRVLALNYF